MVTIAIIIVGVATITALTLIMYAFYITGKMAGWEECADDMKKIFKEYKDVDYEKYL